MVGGRFMTFSFIVLYTPSVFLLSQEQNSEAVKIWLLLKSLDYFLALLKKILHGSFQQIFAWLYWTCFHSSLFSFWTRKKIATNPSHLWNIQRFRNDKINISLALLVLLEFTFLFRYKYLFVNGKERLMRLYSNKQKFF